MTGRETVDPEDAYRIGICWGHSSGHEGHIPRHLLEASRQEGLVTQGSVKRRRLEPPDGSPVSQPDDLS